MNWIPLKDIGHFVAVDEAGRLLLMAMGTDGEPASDPYEPDWDWPTEYAEWQTACRNRGEFEKMCGRSRIGCLGAKVTVILDGKKV